jgi:hypothetical protein
MLTATTSRCRQCIHLLVAVAWLPARFIEEEVPMSRVFELANLTVLPFWALMILAPRARLTGRVLASPWVVLAPSVLYAWVVVPAFMQILPIVARPELNAVARLLGQPAGATAAWAHFLAFDLWVGRFIVLDGRERGLPGPVLSVIALLTLLLGPLGLLSYLVLRSGVFAHVKQLWDTAYASSRQLSMLGVLSLLTAAVTSVLPLVDARQLGGATLWLKPTKFGVSIAIASFTLAYLLRAIDVPVTSRKRLVTSITWLTGLELVIITGQAARGVASHFNVSSLLDGVLFQIMGIAITIVTIAVARLGWFALRTEYADRALGSGIRFGIAIMVFGSCLAFLMPRPTPAQLQSLQAGQSPASIGAHTVGAADDAGQGLPLTRWSTAGGDLRVPHFVGLHALQLLPLVGFVLGRRLRGRAALAVSLTRIIGFGYLGIVLTTLVQALRGQPVLAPDAITWALALGTLLGCSMAVLLVTSRLAGREQSGDARVSGVSA